MTTPHRRNLPTPVVRRTVPRAAARSISATLAALVVGAVVSGPAAATGSGLPPGSHPAVVGQQDPGIVEQPLPDATFGEPAPPVPDPTGTSGTDPATGFAINARTGFLVHPGTGHLIEPGSGNLLFADTLIYTNLRYDAGTGEVTEVAGEIAAPDPSAGGTTASSSPSPSPSTVPPAPAPATTAPAPVQPPASAGAATESAAPATPAPSRTTTPPARSSTPVAEAGTERTASLAPIAWIGAGVLAVALAVVVVARRRGGHQS